MRTGARIEAARAVLEDILVRHRPASLALADWGKSHRFAGSGDRAAIGNLVYDALRRRSSTAFRMQADTARALVLGAAPDALGLSPSELLAALDESGPHGGAPLSAEERAILSGAVPDISAAPAEVQGDYPAWLAPSLARAFGAHAGEEGAALARRAPVDLRANALKADREKVLAVLARHGAEPCRWSPNGVRIPPPKGAGRTPNVEAEAAHGKGWFEVQDEGAQIAARLCAAAPRQQVLDLCAGAGGKTLALAAEMRNTGQIYAYDRDKVQLRPIFERLKRAGVRSAQVLEGGDEEALKALGARFDLVLADVPCTGSGVWRRRPDSKWRIRPESLPQRVAEQREVLDVAVMLVKPGGRLVYVTCSILPEENDEQIAWLLAKAPELRLKPFAEVWRSTIGSEPPSSGNGRDDTLLLTPFRHGTDGFFIAVLERKP